VKSVLVTGGWGFIGSALVRRLIAQGMAVSVLDAGTYAAQPEALDTVRANPLLREVRGDVADAQALAGAMDPDIDTVFHLAAETHVDRSIDGPAAFVRTNVIGTACVLEAVARATPRPFVVHMSTDEVFGEAAAGTAFGPHSPYAPRSPYAASKAGADHLVSAWATTYGVGAAIAHAGNAFGPWQHPEKLIPTLVAHALAGHPLPLYGDGGHQRAWVHVEDLVDGLMALGHARPAGARVLFGPDAPTTNRALAEQVCAALDAMAPRADARPHASAITPVPDRPGHDRRYAVDPSAANALLGWRAGRTLDRTLADVVGWYVARAQAGLLAPRARLGLGGAR
jgi:dTDP-glucose 4,6-dehydratase